MPRRPKGSFRGIQDRPCFDFVFEDEVDLECRIAHLDAGPFAAGARFPDCFASSITGRLEAVD
jgi:hypothetical protein